MTNPMQFFHWNHRSRYTYSVLNLFWHLGMIFFGISKNVRGCVILVHTEQLTGAITCCSCFYKSVGISKKVNKILNLPIISSIMIKNSGAKKKYYFLYFFKNCKNGSLKKNRVSSHHYVTPGWYSESYKKIREGHVFSRELKNSDPNTSCF